MARILDSFSLARATEGYVLQIEDEDGESTEFSVSVDQLEVIAEEIERHLDEDEDDVLPADDDEADEDEEEA
jgi:hypothetical protein